MAATALAVAEAAAVVVWEPEYQPIHRGPRVAGVIALAWKRPRHALCPATRTGLELVADAASMALRPTGADGSPRFAR